MEKRHRLPKGTQLDMFKDLERTGVVRFAKVRDVKSPVRSTPGSAGIDFFIPERLKVKELTVPAHGDILLPTGIRMEIPEGFMLMGADRSSVAVSRDALLRAGRHPGEGAVPETLVVCAGIIDSDYQGEIFIHLVNPGRKSVRLRSGMKIAQFILIPVGLFEPVETEEKGLFEQRTDRGGNGFGSTGGI